MPDEIEIPTRPPVSALEGAKRHLSLIEQEVGHEESRESLGIVGREIFSSRLDSSSGEAQPQQRRQEIRHVLDELGLLELDVKEARRLQVADHRGVPLNLPMPEELVKLPALFEVIGDIHARQWAEFPNDYKLTIRLPYSEKIDLEVEITSEQCPIMCGNCFDPIAEYPCSHHEGEYDYLQEWKISAFPISLNEAKSVESGGT